MTIYALLIHYPLHFLNLSHDKQSILSCGIDNFKCFHCHTILFCCVVSFPITFSLIWTYFMILFLISNEQEMNGKCLRRKYRKVFLVSTKLIWRQESAHSFIRYKDQFGWMCSRCSLISFQQNLVKKKTIQNRQCFFTGDFAAGRNRWIVNCIDPNTSLLLSILPAIIEPLLYS